MTHRFFRVKHFILEKVWNLKRYFFHRGSESVGPENISIVVVGRNDNYGGDFSLRLKTTLDWNLKQLPGAELIYVEWNRIEDRESDCFWIEKRYPEAKCYIVPNEIHNQITQNKAMPVLEYFAKNLALRKASRDWIIMINADCFIGPNVMKNINRLNKNYVYATHYVSFRWDQEPLSERHTRAVENFVITFSASANLSAVVGNFILTHKQNWLNATGYDEKLTNVRAGVDSNGLNQLLHAGLKPMVLGHHYHLDHPESIIHGTNQSHGSHAFNNIPYKNGSNWGFAEHPLKQLSDRIWQLEKI